MNTGSKIKGKDIYGNEVQGIITNIMPTFGMAQITHGNDRLDTTTVDLKDVAEVK